MGKKTMGVFLTVLSFIFSAMALPAQDTSGTGLLSKTRILPPDSEQHYLRPGALIIPGSFLVYGGLKSFAGGIQQLDDHIMDRIRQRHAGFHTNVADYLTWVPSASVYLLDNFKVETAHAFRQQLLIEAGSIVITGSLGYGMRLISKNIGAYNTRGTKFPSGHTANAFRGAEIFHQELRKNYPALSYSGYLAATAVGLLRIYNKDHLLSEVLAGAGLGILSTKLTYWLFDKATHRKKQ